MLTKYFPYISAGSSLLYGRLRRRPFPWYINYFITARCNLKCPYCYAVTNRIKGEREPLPEAGHPKDPSLKEILDIIAGLHRLGTRYIALVGGEPLIRGDLDEIVTYIKRKNMLVTIGTNGTLMDKHIDILKKVHRVAISLEADKEEHDKDRGAGTYDKTIKNIRVLKENNFNNITVQMTVSANTLDSWEHVVRIAKEIGFTVLITEIVCRPGENIKEANIDQSNLISFWSRVLELKKEGYPIENSSEAISNVLNYSKYIGPFEIFSGSKPLPEPLKKFVKYNKCPMGKYNAFLDFDGTFYPCASLFGIRGYGYNIYEMSIDTAYNMMSKDNSCKCCRMMLNCQTNYLFSSLNPFTLFHIAFHALKNYNYQCPSSNDGSE